MLRQRSLKSKLDVKHRKSTSSEHAVHLEHLDPTIAQRDANIAACKAYKQAESRAREDIPLFPLTPESSPRRHPTERSGQGQDDINAPFSVHGNGRGVCRQQSVRFMGPCSVQPRERKCQRQYASRNSTDGGPDKVTNELKNSDMNSSQNQVLGLLKTDDSDQLPSPPQRPPPPVPLPEYAASYLDGLAAEEYYTPEDDVASAPSSYRRLPKPKPTSTADPRSTRRSLQTQTFLAETSPGIRSTMASSARRLSRSDPSSSNVPHAVPPLRTPKSMSFLGSRSFHARFSTNQDSNANGQNLSDSREEVPTPEGHPTSQQKPKGPDLLQSLSRRTEQRMRKSLRGSGSTEEVLASSPNHKTLLLGSRGFKSKARNMSKSFKTKLKTFFSTVGPGGETPSIPCQHIDAQRTHVNEAFGTSRAADTECEGSAIQAGETIHTVPARMPSLHESPQGLVHSRKASLESLKTERERQASDDKSLTSWAHSGPSTLTSQQQEEWREWEGQRLSVINENGPQAASPSTRRPGLHEQLFHRPENNTGKPHGPGKIVDSQRVYSALMKRMRDIHKQAASIAEQRSRSSDTEKPAVSEEPGGRSPSQTPDTVRHAISRMDHLSVDNQVTPTRRSKKTNCSRAETVETGARLASGSTAANPCRSVLGPPTGDSAGTLTPPRRMASELERGPSEMGSRFTDSPASYLFRTASPYRRALSRSMHEEQDAWARQSSVSESQGSDTGTQVHHTSGWQELLSDGNSNFERDVAYSESVYSADEGPGAEMEAGYTMPTMPRNFSNDLTPSRVRPLRGHVREPAQIHGYPTTHGHFEFDFNEDPFEPSTEKPTLPTTNKFVLPLAQVQNNVVRQTTSPLKKPYCEGGLGDIGGGSVLVENQNPPPVPDKSVLRPSSYTGLGGGGYGGECIAGNRGKQASRCSSPSGASSAKTASPGLTAALRRQFGSGPGSSWRWRRRMRVKSNADKDGNVTAGWGEGEVVLEEEEDKNNYCRVIQVKAWGDDESARAFV
ncbi:hypothetical protein N656DRAFT_3806 [Canariomyces notabilis]|uniref:Uncharacterized protein n=1 Tax=Canariomyces notabilis TaxID=2074819 RepID=A0AAN6YWT1_9PEZI|nr:hypothetical protein N656DRAFT_3806 [Canariomyces arenarius]